MDDHELIDIGGGARLERFGEHVTDRPHAGALGERRSPGRWAEADLRFDRERGWSSTAPGPVVDRWTIRFGGSLLELRPTEAGQVGLYPEHTLTLPWLVDQIERRRAAGRGDRLDRREGKRAVKVLHLFAHTGLATLALARAGASVAHVDASRPAVAWARRNAELNDLSDRPIRWLVDDARAFTLREVRRSRRYDGIVLDPPSFGHGATGRRWELLTDLPELLIACRSVLAPDGFVLLTAHSEDLGPDRLAGLLADALPRPAGRTSAGDLILTTSQGDPFPLGAYARLEGAA